MLLFRKIIEVFLKDYANLEDIGAGSYKGDYQFIRDKCRGLSSCRFQLFLLLSKSKICNRAGATLN